MHAENVVNLVGGDIARLVFDGAQVHFHDGNPSKVVQHRLKDGHDRGSVDGGMTELILRRLLC